ncbi:MAG: glycosyltransferase family 2 protein [Patescibacteria group bacterium]|nr:glycosyltransferase family 2 protein [Patescibacteria group bacterium]
MLFDLCLPARNEGAIIQDVLRRLVKALNDISCDWRIIVAVNGTTDDTVQRIEEYRQMSPDHASRIVFIERPEPGKGAAIKFAAQYSQADLFGFIDADLSADPEMIVPMANRLIRGGSDLVIGSRLINIKTTNRGFLRTLSSQFFNLMAHLILGVKVKDAQCGLKIMNSKAKNLLSKCREEGWFLDIEFLAKAVQDGLIVTEVPVPWIEFRYAGRKSQVNMVKDGWQAVKAMLRIKRSNKYV